ncbi:MAG: 2-phospho-L-lactate guanylyltransferase [SAR202 cluster bacterium]|nr:2-phospho-L-lactate guanylyltransferase [SAR202 cluster bacterium]
MSNEAPPLRVIVPMKPIANGKRRLAAGVPDPTREALAAMMLHHVVGTVTAALGNGACWVIGGDAYVRRLAREAGGTWLDDHGADLNGTVLHGMLRAYEEGSAAALFLPADLPMATPDDIHAIVAASDGLTRPVGVEATNDGGTNALLIPAGLDVTPALGHRSYSRHRMAVERAGSRLTPAPAFGLVFDLDEPDDLAYAKANIPGFVAGLDHWEQRLLRDNDLVHPPPRWLAAEETTTP